jgi:membrane protein DedA with SNARE-associated domain
MAVPATSLREGSASIQDLIIHYGVLIVALMVFVGELGVPTGMPVEVALMIAGAFAIHSIPGLIAALIVVMLADIVGTTTLHLVARTGGVRLLNQLLRKHEERSREFLEYWRVKFGGHDTGIVFVGRLLPIARMYVAIGTGLIRIPFGDYVIGASPAALIWAGLPLTIGYFLRSDVNRFTAQYTRVEHIAMIVLPVLIVAALIAWWVHRGGSLRGRVLRVRSAGALIVALGIVAYMVQSVWINDESVEKGVGGLPPLILWSWLAILAILAFGLIIVAISDFRLMRRLLKHRHLPLPQLVRTELTTTLVWLTLILSAGAVMVEIELRYPIL